MFLQNLIQKLEAERTTWGDIKLAKVYIEHVKGVVATHGMPKAPSLQLVVAGPPTLEEVKAAGYTSSVAESIVREEAGAAQRQESPYGINPRTRPEHGTVVGNHLTQAALSDDESFVVHSVDGKLTLAGIMANVHRAAHSV